MDSGSTIQLSAAAQWVSQWLDLSQHGYLTALLMHAEVSLLLFAFTSLFFIDFVRKAATRIRVLHNTNKAIVDRGVNDAFDSDPDLQGCWTDFERTLLRTAEGKLRSSECAESFFRQQLLVDQYVNADFYRHLPGILTGIGIIGTFLGLMDGLDLFLGQQQSLDARMATEVTGLLTHVRYAFMVSATAIGASVVVTVIEKKMLSKLHLLHDQLVRYVDQQVEGGLGEHYFTSLIEISRQGNQQQYELMNSLEKLQVRQSEPQDKELNARFREMKSLMGTNLNEQQKTVAMFDQLSAGFYSSLSDLVEKFEQNAKIGQTRVEQTIELGTKDLVMASQSLNTVVGKVAELLNSTREAAAQQENFSSRFERLNQTMERMLHSQQETQLITSSLINQLEAVTKQSDRSLHNSERVLESLGHSSTLLAAAVDSASNYLQGVSQIIAESQEGFNSAMFDALEHNNAEFQQQLGKAILLLSEAVDKVSAQLGALSDRDA